MLRTPLEAADALYAAIPHAIARATLEEYGLEVETGQAQQITQEMLSLSLFWIHCALEAVLPPRQREQVLGELRRRILGGWVGELALDGQDAPRYFEEAEERRRIYAQATQEGASPVAIATETAALLVAGSAIRREDQMKALALVTDLVPVDELGQLADEIRLSG
jgi:hypothetical protein